MKKNTDIAVYDGDMFSMSTEELSCHICGTVVPAGEKRMSFGSIRNGDPHSGTLSWCEVCVPCSEKIIEIFKPKQVVFEHKTTELEVKQK
jgi:ribosomal protein S27E